MKMTEMELNDERERQRKKENGRRVESDSRNELKVLKTSEESQL